MLRVTKKCVRSSLNTCSVSSWTYEDITHGPSLQTGPLQDQDQQSSRSIKYSVSQHYANTGRSSSKEAPRKSNLILAMKGEKLVD